MRSFSQWCLLLALWAIVLIALLIGSPVHAQIATGTSASSSSTTTTTTTTAQSAAPQIVQAPLATFQAPLMAPVCPAPTFGAPLGYGASFGTGFGYGRSFGAPFGYGRSFGFHRGFGAPFGGYGRVGFATVPAVRVVTPRVNVVTPAAAVVVPRRTVIRTTPRRQVIRIR